MQKVLRTVALAIAVWGVASTGCAASTEPSPEGTGGEVESVSSGVGTCAQSTGEKQTQQRRASAVLRYILGGNAPAWPTSTNGRCQNLRAHADEWRANFAAGATPDSQGNLYGRMRSAVLQPRTTVCGLTAAPVKFDVFIQYAVDSPQAALVMDMMDCYGNSIQPFADIGTANGACVDAACKYRHSYFTMDPEVATLSGNLGGTAGSTAAATLSSDGSSATAWTAAAANQTPTYKPSMTLGAPCNTTSTSSTPAGTLLDKIVSPVYGSSGAVLTGYRRCLTANDNIF